MSENVTYGFVPPMRMRINCRDVEPPIVNQETSVVQSFDVTGYCMRTMTRAGAQTVIKYGALEGTLFAQLEERSIKPGTMSVDQTTLFDSFAPHIFGDPLHLAFDPRFIEQARYLGAREERLMWLADAIFNNLPALPA